MRKQFVNLSKHWVYTLAVLLSSLGAAAAQTTTCGPAQIEGFAGFVPVMQPPYFDETVQVSLQDGYRSLYGLRNMDQARTALMSALRTSEAAKNSCGEALAAYGLGEVSSRVSVSDAEKWFQRAEASFLVVHSDLGLARTHFELAGVHNTENKPQAKKEYEEAGIELERAGAPIGAIMAKLGAISFSEDNTARFDELQRQAQLLKSPCAEAQVLQTWGSAGDHASDYESAIEHYQAAYDLYAHCPSGKSQLAFLQTDMGRLERQHGRAAMALPHYRVALRLQQESGDPSYIPQTYNAMSVAYHAMGDHQRAITYLKLGLTEAERIHSQPFIDFLRANLGSEYLRDGYPALGVPLLEGATKDLHSDTLICRRNLQLADAYRRVERYDESLAKSAVALEACERERTDDEVSIGLNDRAKTELKLGRLEEARADSQRSLQILEALSAHLVEKDAYKQAYGDAQQTRDTYKTAIDVLMLMHRYDEALETAEQGRSRAFLDLLSSEQADGKQATQTQGSKTFRTVLIESRKHSAALTTEQMLGEAARLHSTLLVYWLSDSTLYTWVARPGQPVIGVTQAVNSATLEKLVKSTQPDGETSHTSPVAESARWRKLYLLLIAPVQSDLPTEQDALLTIVPSGPLFQLSFAALTDAHGRYLLEHYRLHTIPTVGLLQFTQHNSETADTLKSHFLFVSEPEHLPLDQNGKRLPEISGTRTEVAAISRMMPASQVETLQGDRAVKSLLTARASQATVLHFATHAVVDDAHPEKTFLALDATQDHGRFTLADVYSLDLNARLVVLSACRTGLGQITGDGVMGLSRAFFYAGSASVLTTLWDIADEPTAAMLPNFYRSLNSGKAPSDALRIAQLKMLNDLRRGRIKAETLQGRIALPPSPAYWAAFVLSGEP